jgi:serine/threonine-protein kinase HipA
MHHEDLCQALALRPSNKYGNQNPGVSFEGALRLVTDACGEDQGREMARRCGFNIAAGNGDAHLKNWGLVWGERTRPILAPCYDLVATISWAKLGWTDRSVPRMALKLGRTDRFSYLDAGRLEDCASASGCAWAKDEILAGIARARDAWPTLEAPLPARMTSALEAHWLRVPILRAFGPLAH